MGRYGGVVNINDQIHGPSLCLWPLWCKERMLASWNSFGTPLVPLVFDHHSCKTYEMGFVLSFMETFSLRENKCSK